MDFATLNAMSPEDLRAQFSQSPEQTAELLRVAAENGVADACVLYGQMHLDGHGVGHDPVAALKWFHTGAKAGSPMAMNMVGRCCELGWGVQVDKSAAAEWYKVAATFNLDWALYNLATLLTLGDGVPMDREEGLRLYRKAADMGHVKSLNMVGGFYEDGWCVEQDMTVAADYYCRAAQGGDFRGQFNHARMLILEGQYEDAGRWIQSLARTATPDFRAKAKVWLSRQEDSHVRMLGDMLG